MFKFGGVCEIKFLFVCGFRWGLYYILFRDRIESVLVVVVLYFLYLI